ncbi:hypothetical protein GFS60_01855 [Rhodococcus sp. WAY2]|nr:hypothetical protein GFS60_01855 [Rhodococcus sp. WAY2]
MLSAHPARSGPGQRGFGSGNTAAPSTLQTTSAACSSAMLLVAGSNASISAQ